jgi:hypothetical protein
MNQRIGNVPVSSDHRSLDLERGTRRFAEPKLDQCPRHCARVFAGSK